ncbi:MAG: alpha/beta hydrolase [Eubacteriales bacterium]
MQTQSYFLTTDGGESRLHVCRVLPDEEPRFVLQIIHGIAERVERYLPLAQYIAGNGGAVLLHDLRGHGASVPNPRLLGDCGDLYRTYRDDLHAVFRSFAEHPAEGELLTLCPPEDGEETEELPSLPRYMLGFSMGALLAGLYAAASSADLAGLILAGLPRREPLVSFALAGMGIWTFFAGEHVRPKGLNRYAFERYNKGFSPEPESDGQFLWLSNDIGNRAAFAADPICNRPNTLGTYQTLLRLLRDMYRPASWNMDRRELPVFMTAGALDPVAGGEAGVRDAAKFLADMGYTNLRTKLYEGFRHEIFQDTGREIPFADVLAFINETTGAENARLDARRNEYQKLFG